MPRTKQFCHNLNTRPVRRAQTRFRSTSAYHVPHPLDCSLVVVNKRPVVRMLDGPDITDGRKHPHTKCLAHITFQHMSNTKHYSVRWRWACPGDLEDYDQDKCDDELPSVRGVVQEGRTACGELTSSVAERTQGVCVPVAPASYPHLSNTHAPQQVKFPQDGALRLPWMYTQPNPKKITLATYSIGQLGQWPTKMVSVLLESASRECFSRVLLEMQA
jgi:hypothetical protein